MNGHDVGKRGQQSPARLDNPALRRAEALLEQGNPDGAIAACAEALEIQPDICSLRAVLLQCLADAPDVARQEICDLLQRTDPRDAAQDAGIAAALIAERRFEAALPLLRRVVRPLEGGHESAWNYVLCLEELGLHGELLGFSDFLDRLASRMEGRLSLYSELSNARLVEAADRAGLVRELRALEGSSLWLAPEQAADRIGRAIHDMRPFSLVHYGYVETRIVCATSRHAAFLLRPAELEAVAERSWAECSTRPLALCDARTVGRLGMAYRAAAQAADILCLPSAYVLEHDNRHVGFFAEQERELRSGRYRPSADLQTMARIAETDPGLKSLLGGLPFAGIVTITPGLADRIAATCGFGAVTEILLAPAPLDGMLEAIGSIWVPYPGAVFLVAAGALTPCICGYVASKGGIALDVGTCLQTWDA